MNLRNAPKVEMCFHRSKHVLKTLSMDTVSVADSPAAPPRASPLYGRPLDSRGHPDIP